jgi:hypothetical protein
MLPPNWREDPPLRSWLRRAGDCAQERVENLRAGSEAAKAGLREGDRVTYTSSTEGAQRDPQQTITMQVTRGDRRFEVTYLPRESAVDGYQWIRESNVPESHCRSH